MVGRAGIAHRVLSGRQFTFGDTVPASSVGRSNRSRMYRRLGTLFHFHRLCWAHAPCRLDMIVHPPRDHGEHVVGVLGRPSAAPPQSERSSTSAAPVDGSWSIGGSARWCQHRPARCPGHRRRPAGRRTNPAVLRCCCRLPSHPNPRLGAAVAVMGTNRDLTSMGICSAFPQIKKGIRGDETHWSITPTGAGSPAVAGPRISLRHTR